MTADNRRKEEQSKAKLENSGESSVSSLNSVMADKAARNNFFLPSNEQSAYIASDRKRHQLTQYDGSL